MLWLLQTRRNWSFFTANCAKITTMCWQTNTTTTTTIASLTARYPKPICNYTIAEGDGVPFSYSLYRLQGDYRMGKTFQIKTQLNQSMAYPMTQFSDKLTQSILDYSNNYREKPGYYPNRDSVDVQYYTQAQDRSGLECKELCNDNSNCRYYFTYTSNEKPKCIIDGDNSTPHYNRVPPANSEHPIDENTSSLFFTQLPIGH